MKSALEYQQIAVKIRQLLNQQPFHSNGSREGLQDLLDDNEVSAFEDFPSEVNILKDYLCHSDPNVMILGRLLVHQAMYAKHDSTLGRVSLINQLFSKDFILNLLKKTKSKKLISEKAIIIDQEIARTWTMLPKIELSILSTPTFERYCAYLSSQKNQFDLSYTNFASLGSRDIKKLIDAFALSPAQSLNLTQCFRFSPYVNWRYAKLLFGAASKKNINSLILANNNLFEYYDIWQEICSTFNSPALRYLDISNCRINNLSENNLRFLRDALQESGIAELIISDNPEFLRDHVARMLPIFHNEHLKHVSLANNELFKLSNAQLEKLFYAINRSELESLDLSGNNLSALNNAGLELLSKFIATTPLKKLYLNNNGPKIVAYVEDALNFNHDLIKIAGVGDAACNFQSKIKRNQILEKLFVTTTTATEEISKKIPLQNQDVLIQNIVEMSLNVLIPLQNTYDEFQKSYKPDRAIFCHLLKRSALIQITIIRFAIALFRDRKYRLDLVLKISMSPAILTDLIDDYFYSALEETKRATLLTTNKKELAAQAALITALPYFLFSDSKQKQLMLDTYLIESFSFSLEPDEQMQISNDLRISLMQMIILTRIHATHTPNLNLKDENNEFVASLSLQQLREIAEMWKAIHMQTVPNDVLPAISYAKMLAKQAVEDVDAGLIIGGFKPKIVN